MNNSFDNVQCEEITRYDECMECGATLVVIQDEYSDAVICPECDCEDDDDYQDYDDDDYDGQPSEMDEWLDFDPDC